MNPKRTAHLEKLRLAKIKHGAANHPLYSVYYSMRGRCLNEQNKAFKNYGARGIKVCAEWMSGFDAFYAWALANNWARGLHLDRIDTNGNYSPENCRFTSQAENNRNRRNTPLTPEMIAAILAASGTGKEISSQFGVSASVVGKVRSGNSYKHLTNKGAAS